MILGRMLGVTLAVLLAYIFPPSLASFILAVFVGTIGGLSISMFIGAMVSKDQPLPMDALDYWTEKYGETIGREAYRAWLEEV